MNGPILLARQMSTPIAVIFGAAFLLAASSAESAERPLSPAPGGTRLVAPVTGGTAAASSTGLIKEVAPSSLTGSATLISFQSIDTTSPPGTNPFAGRNYDGVVTPGGTCADATMCSGGETLCNGICVDTPADPSNCGACGNECAPGTTCQSGRCAAPPGSCLSDSECGSGLYCAAGTCVLQGAAGSLCTSDSQCSSSLTCQPFQTADPCVTNADCSGGSGTCTMAGCLYQLCLPVPCMSDGDCPSGSYCDTATGGCVFQQGGGAACSSGDQCQSERCNGVAQFAERFVGQSLSYDGDFDVLNSSASGALALQVGAPTFNLDAGMGDMGKVYLAGLGPVGYSPALPLVNPNYDGIGEGAVAALFHRDHAEVAFDVEGVDGGGFLYIDFFRRDGSLIDTLMVSTGPPMSEAIAMTLAFRSTSGNTIAGISIYNTDPGGVGYSSFRLGFEVEVETAPALSLGMLVLVVLVLTAIGGRALLRLRGVPGHP
ncbi:MAG: hypothetical protein U0587_13980 [Candidatus Binatia bacterium]